MIFLEYFKRHLGKATRVILKNEMVITGTLKNVDHFLNLQLRRAKGEYPGLGKMELCSIRGSSVKYIELERNEELEKRVTDATILKFTLDN